MTKSPPRVATASQVAPNGKPTTALQSNRSKSTTKTDTSVLSSKAPRPASQAQKILPKGAKKPATTIQASRSTRELSEMTLEAKNGGLKSPLKGILKKPRNLDESINDR